MPTLLFALLAVLQTPHPVTIEPVGPKAWRMTITAMDETDPLRLAERLRPAAEQLCGPAGFYFDRYTFQLDQLAPGETREADRLDTLTLIQDVACGPAPAEPPPPPPAPVLTDAEAQALNPELEALSTRFFAAVDAGRHAESFAMADTAMTGGGTLKQWSESAERSLAQAGPVKRRQIGRLTWYSNPPGVPHGHYGAVDYVASRALQDECGYLVWYRPHAGAEFRLSRQETSLLPHDLDAATLAALRQQYCIIL